MAIATGYDDGGFSGGTLERPALKALLADIAAGKVDVVVVYKIDRLTRALTDFAKIVEVFDQASASFVSITQAFNTTTSMGRLTLNVLLSFAQFEREVTGERIRDKIAQSKAKGMWMGGNILLGYDVVDQMLIVNQSEAEAVRLIYRRYLELGLVRRLQADLEARGIYSKQWIGRSGKSVGGQVFSRGSLYHLLRNRHYLGEIVHRKLTHPGLHTAIVDPELFEQVQRQLGEHRRRAPLREANKAAKYPMLLTGRIFDGEGDPMSPAVCQGREKKPYGYYVSSSLQTGAAPAAAPSLAPRRLPARPLEAFILKTLQRLADQENAEWSTLSPLLLRIDARAASTELLLDGGRLCGRRHPELVMSALRRRLTQGEEVVREGGDCDSLRVRLPVRLQFRGGRGGVVEGSPLSRVNLVLVGALRSAHLELNKLHASPFASLATLAAASSPQTAYFRRLTQLAFLAPDLQQAILDGREPGRLTLQTILETDIPLAWSEQRGWWRGLT